MRVPEPDQRRRATGLLLLAAALLALAPRVASPAGLDVAIASSRAHALVRIGFATVSVAFEFGQEGPKPDGCGRLPL